MTDRSLTDRSMSNRNMSDRDDMSDVTGDMKRNPRGCEDLRGSFSAYLDEELTAPEAQGVEQHVAGCEPCHEVLQDLRQVVAQVRAVPDLGVPAGLSESVRLAHARGARPGEWAEGTSSALELETSFPAPQGPDPVTTQRVRPFPWVRLRMALSAAVLLFACVYFGLRWAGEDDPATTGTRVASRERIEPVRTVESPEPVRPAPVPSGERREGSNPTFLPVAAGDTGEAGSSEFGPWADVDQVQVVWIRCVADAPVSELSTGLGLGEFAPATRTASRSLAAAMDVQLEGSLLTGIESMTRKRLEEILEAVTLSQSLDCLGSAPADLDRVGDVLGQPIEPAISEGRDLRPVLFLIELR